MQKLDHTILYRIQHNAISWNIGETVKMEAKEVETTPALKHMTNYECVHCEATERRGKVRRRSKDLNVNREGRAAGKKR